MCVCVCNALKPRGAKIFIYSTQSIRYSVMQFREADSHSPTIVSSHIYSTFTMFNVNGLTLKAMSCTQAVIYRLNFYDGSSASGQAYRHHGPCPNSDSYLDFYFIQDF